MSRTHRQRQERPAPERARSLEQRPSRRREAVRGLDGAAAQEAALRPAGGNFERQSASLRPRGEGAGLACNHESQAPLPREDLVPRPEEPECCIEAATEPQCVAPEPEPQWIRDLREDAQMSIEPEDLPAAGERSAREPAADRAAVERTESGPSVDDAVRTAGVLRNRMGVARTVLNESFGATPGSEALGTARNGLSIVAGTARAADGVLDLGEAVANGDPASAHLHAMRDIASGGSWVAGGAGNRAISDEMAAAGNALRVMEGMAEWEECGGTHGDLDASIAAAEDVVRGTGGLATHMLPPDQRGAASAAWELGWDWEDRGSDWAREQGVLGRNTLEGTDRDWSDWAADAGLGAQRALRNRGCNETVADVAGAVVAMGASIPAAGGALVTGVSGWATDAWHFATGQRPAEEQQPRRPRRQERGVR